MKITAFCLAAAGLLVLTPLVFHGATKIVKAFLLVCCAAAAVLLVLTPVFNGVQACR